MRVIIEVSAAMTIASGGMMLSSFYFAIHLAASMNPYHRPLAPMIGCLASFLVGLSIATAFFDGSPMSAARGALSDAVASILSLLPLAFAFATFHLIKITMRKLPEDPLMALLVPSTSDE
ncbi:MAG: hypothetical protein QF760_03315 [Candidatus Thalassarchaeaceae archaeon]|jgi:hypothetical protein|nr:hypothetical protein [Candidatus Thalassarchaeaceae archaeon]MDP6703538.1 hypothetical protein [Candidatus Thalassarchaeaceae archaeon]MDP7004483.1 hypothetical protein [Candidatus Thalassarchaeaceae archaeon]